MKPEELRCSYLLEFKQPPEWRGQDTALGKTEPDRHSYVCGHKRRFKRACKILQDAPCPITGSFEFPE